MKFAITIVSPPGYVHSAAFHEIAETLHYGLLALGYDSVLTAEGQLPERQHIVLGANLLPHYPLPLSADAILYNFEQVQHDSLHFPPEMLAMMRRHTVWDYNQQNATKLASLDVQVSAIVPVGYVPELSRIELAAQPDIDVLFFGSINARRQATIDQMRALGLRVETLFGVYGAARDAVISRAKLVLNVHYYEAKVLEMPRIAYLLANRCAVLSEHSADPVEDAALANGVKFGSYEELPQMALSLVVSQDERARLAAQGFELVQSRPITQYLKTALEQVLS
ncbi:hypothetical protein VSR34_33670 [Paraburkholderia sp. JHI2823]|uniref:hypothetical protein n=1 Tax=Paraburkholderia TaxID=1822464 RepID=UPI00316C343D